MKLHLPVVLRKALLACFSTALAFSMSSGSSFAEDLSLGSSDSLIIDYADSTSIPSLNNGELQLDGDTVLSLLNAGQGDGKTYTLLTGVAGLVDAEGNAITLDSSNNAISNYFDISMPGDGFWSGGILQLVDGKLQIRLHGAKVTTSSATDGVTRFTSRQSGSKYYEYYKGIRYTSSGGDGGAIYGGSSSTITLNNNGSVVFSGNTASYYGGAIYGDRSSTITLNNNGSVVFSGNTASYFGGAIDGSVTMSNNGSVVFSGNTASYSGGAIDGSVTLSNNGSVVFSGNTAASDYGGAIRGSVTMSNNGSVVFSGNRASDDGGAIYGGSNNTINLSNNGSVVFSGNTASYSGGAIYVSYGGNIQIQNNDSVVFEKNAEISTGGTYTLCSIYAYGSRNDISLSAAENKNIEFRDSIYISSGSTVKLNADYTDNYGVVHKQTGDIIFTGAYTETHLNELLTDAGAGRVATSSEIASSRTSEVRTKTNLYGGRLIVEDGAIYSGLGIIANEGSGATVRVKDAVLEHSGYDLTFNAGTTLELAGSNSIFGNVLMKDGSGLSFDGSETIGKSILQGNLSFVNSANIVLSENTDWSGQNEVLLYVAGDITGFAADSLTISGGNGNNVDLRCIDGTLLVLNYNADTFNPYCMGDWTLTSRQISPVSYKYFNNLSFENISSSNYGSAIYEGNGHNVELRNNGAVTFSRNVSSGASCFGGAIYTTGSLSIKNNGSVLFEKNAEIKNGTYRLRSIYANGSGDVISFSAAENKGIEFRDSVYIGSGSTVNLNADYTDASGVVHKQTGDIIFTGAYTETHLNELLTDAGAGRVATEEEILNSRTNEVQAVTNLYGGRLRVEDGAIYSGRGIIVHEGSGATVRVKDAVLNQCGYDLTFNSGSTLELAGANSISGNVFMQENSWLSFDGSESMGVSSLLGDLTFVDGVNISLNGYDALNVQNEILMRVQGSLSGWDATTLTVLNGESDNTADLRWIDGIWLVLNYNEETFDPSFKGEMIVQSRQYSPSEFKNYISLAFENISSIDSGGAIYEDKGGSTVLSENRTVTFRGNTVSSSVSSSFLVSRGGAIYGNNVGLCCNESVIFQDNCALATAWDSNAQGGAIYGNDIELNDNGSVIFCGNTALSDSQYHYHIPGHAIASGGALYATGDLNIRNNDSALFEKNVEITDGTYRLRSIHAEGSGNVISLSASDGKSIEFRDSIYVGDGATVELNADYTDASGVVHKQTGDIIITGAYAETHLNELLTDANAKRVATSLEIFNSRVSEVWSIANLYGGHLRVEDGAIYRGCGITAVEGSNSTVRVKDAVLQHIGCDLTFSAGSTLELAGANRVSGNVLMKEDSWLAFDGSESMGLTILLGDMSFEGGANISLSGYSDLSEQNKILLYVVGSLSGCDADSLSISGGEGNTADVSWIDGGMMVLNYNAETFNPYYMGDIIFTSSQTNQQGYCFYKSVAFENISGGAIDGVGVILCGNGEVSFEENGIYAYNVSTYGGGLSSIGGGAIDGVDIVLSGNSSVIFRDNEIQFSTYLDYPDGNEWTKKFCGGAIYGNGVVELSGNDNVIISGNEASCSIDTYHTYLDVTVKVEGGAIYGDSESSVSLIGNQNVSFNSNSAHAYTSVADRLFNYYSHRVNAKGGAISAFDVYFGNNGDIEFSENSSSVVLRGYDYYGKEVPVDSSTTYSYAEGGAIFGTNVDLQDNGSVTFRDNTVASTEGLAYAYGGAISGNNIALNSNDSVTFDGNTASAQSSSEAVAYGGAIFGSNIDLRANESLSFHDNAVSAAAAADTGQAYARGGAIYGKDIVINNNGSLTFSGNIASTLDGSYGYTYSGGGAIYGYGNKGISLSGNEAVTFSGNTASAEYNASGGAIYCVNDVTLNGNGTVTFSGNTASAEYMAYGGAIDAGGIYIQNNDIVLFEKNAEITDGAYRLRSIYAGGRGDVISLSAADDKSIEFRDSIYISSGSVVKLNADYTDENGVVHKQTGDIIFTGAYTETHLNDLLEDAGAGRVATAGEIQASRTTEVYAITNIYGGRLRIEDGAIFKGNGITAHVNSGSTVRVQDSVLEHSGSNLTFNAGTTLELAGNNSISGNINMLEGSTLSFDVSERSAISIINGSVHFEDDVALSVITDNTLLRENTILMLVNGSITGWNSADQRFFLFGDSLVYNYNKDTFDGYFMGDREFATRQSDDINMKYYRSLSFSNITNEAPYGGAISGNKISMSYNRSVDFIGNSVDGSEGALGGGAINGNEIILNNNGNVSFIGNTACSDDTNAYVYGGAIFGQITTLNGNDTVSFIDNKASAVSDYCVYMQGGAISGDNITLSKNGTVTFRGNSISSNSSYDFCYTYGGAIYGAINRSSVILSDNGLVTFTNNTASSTSTYVADTTGGAIDATSIKLSGNETVTFRGNGVSTTILFVSDHSAHSYSSCTSGGAISGQEVSLINNEVVTFDANTASSSLSNINEFYSSATIGGAIYGTNISLCGNGDVTFSSNSVSSSSTNYAEAFGGAIYAWDNLSIRNNDSVLFEKNAEVTNGSYRLRSIYANGLSLSAAQNKSIEIRDSVYLGSGRTVSLNADYTDADGVMHKQTGDIIFTGAYTETHLNDLLEEAGAGRVATAEEILNSRTSEVQTMTNLYGGRLRVEDGAIYQGYGITAMEGSNATVRVKNATLSHSGYDLTFHDGTSLEIDGVSSVSGNVNLLSGSFLNILANSTLDMEEYSILRAENGANIALGTDATLNLEGAFEAGDAVILELSDGAAVSRGVTTICNNGGKDVVHLDAVAFASGTMQKVKDAHVIVDSSEDTSITYQLENASVENRGSGKLTMTHENNSISSVSSAGGDVEILNVDSSDMGNILKLTSLELHESAVFGAYVGDTVSADAEACVQVSGSAVFGVGTTVNADLVLMDGCVLTMDDTVRMGSDLSINGTHTLDGDLLSLIQNAEIGMHFDLFTGIDDLYLNDVLFDSIALTDNMSASTYFIGLEDVPESERYYRLSYASEIPGEGVLSVHVVSIPEPTTATLGILALAGLAARRRRRW